MSLPPW
jgi:hypothetical protein